MFYQYLNSSSVQVLFKKLTIDTYAGYCVLRTVDPLVFPETDTQVVLLHASNTVRVVQADSDPQTREPAAHERKARLVQGSPSETLSRHLYHGIFFFTIKIEIFH